MYRILLALSLLLIVACSTPRASGGQTSIASPTPTAPAAPAPSYAGEWEVTVKDTPGGTVTGTLMLTETADGLTGAFVAGEQETELRTVTAADGVLRLSFYSAEYQTDVDMRLNGAADATTLEGSTMGQFATTATRK
ncbi:hypothetical protein LEM8419_02841 [Neolewinella maritima]|uniref:Lipocalin-like domain-containing protein n=1 Tax=Neolewinella maritima TaxID=1383882 RepID=A0ABN8F7F0_9BACT|nr:hypothetical protein [Neolewinella maritima]CAH1001927.1 hypothetical protein LEM8419_02841 [Neolewinella maritima]